MFKIRVSKREMTGEESFVVVYGLIRRNFKGSMEFMVLGRRKRQ